ncbi:MAG: 2OG-Fe(II) oxygenase [Planctomycetota bacterium]
MSSPKERRKARRRAEKTMDAAFEALLDDDLTLAEKLARRALAGGEMNARLWLDLGRILRRCGNDDDAEAALRRAIALAPTHAEAFAELAQLQADAGKWPQAERLLRRAVELRPDDELLRQRLDSFAAMVPAAADAPAATPPIAPGAPGVLERTAPFDWTAIADELRQRGAARLPALLSMDECAALRALWDQDVFEHRVVLDAETAGRGEYRFLQPPLPPLVQALRAEVYLRLQPIANAWMELLHRRARFPATLAQFLEECVTAGQRRSTPILLRYPAGGCNAPHRDVAGRVVFPFQLAVTLGPEPAARAGGALRLCSVRGQKLREHAVSTEPGDGVVFCTQERLVEVAGVVAAQQVLHGVAECTAVRFALGVPFHEHG